MGNRSWSRSRSQSRSRESPESEPKSRRQFLCRFWKFMSFAWKVFYCVYNSKCVWIAGVCVCECRMGNEWAALFVCALCRLLPAPLSVNVAHKLFNTLPLVAIKKKSTYWWKVLLPHALGYATLYLYLLLSAFVSAMHIRQPAPLAPQQLIGGGALLHLPVWGHRIICLRNFIRLLNCVFSFWTIYVPARLPPTPRSWVTKMWETCVVHENGAGPAMCVPPVALDTDTARDTDTSDSLMSRTSVSPCLCLLSV